MTVNTRTHSSNFAEVRRHFPLRFPRFAQISACFLVSGALPQPSPSSVRTIIRKSEPTPSNSSSIYAEIFMPLERGTMADKARLNHLWNLAVNCAKENPQLSQFYVNEIRSTEENGDASLDNFKLKYCKHCYMVFSADNCRVRLHPKRGKKKRLDDKKCRSNKEILKLHRRLNHVGVFCKTCGKHSFYPGRAGDDKKSTLEKKISFSAPQNLHNNSTNEQSTPVSSKLASSRRRSHNSTLKDLLRADDRKKSATGATPQLKDFLSSLGHSISLT